jgi:hypothetical protein
MECAIELMERAVGLATFSDAVGDGSEDVILG